MLKLICLFLGIALGFGGGIWYGVQHPEWAKDMAAKEEEWVKKGKEQALEQVKAKLDGLIAQKSAAPTGVKSFIAGGSASSEAESLKALKSDVESQLTQLDATKK